MTSGLINILKPPGMTSHDVISFLRRIYGIKKIGHAGTLDPAAAGVLPVAIGQATRLLEYLVGQDKTYRVELTLGYETDTGDAQGHILQKSDFLMPSINKIEKVLLSFLGNSFQIPPMHSAIRMNGKKLYELARQGVEVERKPREIFISKIDLIARNSNNFVFDVTCSKGTYIRSLCQDIGKKLDIPAVMTFLVRTRVGLFNHDDAKTLEEVAQCPQECLKTPTADFLYLPSVVISSEQAKTLSYGQTLVIHQPLWTKEAFPEQICGIDSTNRVLAIAEVSPTDCGYHIKPLKVLTGCKE